MHQIWWIITALLLNTSKNLCAFKKSGSFARNCTQTFLNKQRQLLSLLGPTQTLLHQWTDEAKQMQIMLKVKKLKKTPPRLWFYMQVSVFISTCVIWPVTETCVVLEREWESKHGDRRAESRRVHRVQTAQELVLVVRFVSAFDITYFSILTHAQAAPIHQFYLQIRFKSLLPLCFSCY